MNPAQAIGGPSGYLNGSYKWLLAYWMALAIIYLRIEFWTIQKAFKEEIGPETKIYWSAFHDRGKQ